MVDPKDLEKRLKECFDDFKQYMDESGVESVKFHFPPGAPEPRPEKIQQASTIQILEIKEKPKKEG
jgi:hypothetical protein